MRIGHGYDVHRLVEGRQLIIGGVNIPHKYGLDGHSDADVLIHAIMDALLGAVGFGDIGKHFPDTDNKYKGISCLLLLKRVREILDENGYAIVNIDATIIAQSPKMSPHISDMKSNIAQALNMNPEFINIKATTTEGLGFSGRKEGIAAHAVTLVNKIWR